MIEGKHGKAIYTNRSRRSYLVTRHSTFAWTYCDLDMHWWFESQIQDQLENLPLGAPSTCISRHFPLFSVVVVCLFFGFHCFTGTVCSLFPPFLFVVCALTTTIRLCNEIQTALRCLHQYDTIVSLVWKRMRRSTLRTSATTSATTSGQTNWTKTFGQMLHKGVVVAGENKCFGSICFTTTWVVLTELHTLSIAQTACESGAHIAR